MSASVSKEEVISFIEQMSVLELSEFVKELEDKFGVSAAQPVFAGGGFAAPGGDGASEEEEQTEFTATLKEVGAQKIQVIKVVRTLTGLGLKEAKELVDNAPKPVKEGIEKEEADKIKAALEEVGAKVEIA